MGHFNTPLGWRVVQPEATATGRRRKRSDHYPHYYQLTNGAADAKQQDEIRWVAERQQLEVRVALAHFNVARQHISGSEVLTTPAQPGEEYSLVRRCLVPAADLESKADVDAAMLLPYTY